MTTETEYFWKAARDARALEAASDSETACAAIEELVGVALHFAPALSARALALLGQLVTAGNRRPSDRPRQMLPNGL